MCWRAWRQPASRRRGRLWREGAAGQGRAQGIPLGGELSLRTTLCSPSDQCVWHCGSVLLALRISVAGEIAKFQSHLKFWGSPD